MAIAKWSQNNSKLSSYFSKLHNIVFCLIISSSMNFTKKINIIILMLEFTQLPIPSPTSISISTQTYSSHHSSVNERPFLLLRLIPDLCKDPPFVPADAHSTLPYLYSALGSPLTSGGVLASKILWQENGSGRRGRLADSAPGALHVQPWVDSGCVFLKLQLLLLGSPLLELGSFLLWPFQDTGCSSFCS